MVRLERRKGLAGALSGLLGQSVYWVYDGRERIGDVAIQPGALFVNIPPHRVSVYGRQAWRPEPAEDAEARSLQEAYVLVEHLAGKNWERPLAPG